MVAVILAHGRRAPTCLTYSIAWVLVTWWFMEIQWARTTAGRVLAHVSHGITVSLIKMLFIILVSLISSLTVSRNFSCSPRKHNHLAFILPWFLNCSIYLWCRLYGSWIIIKFLLPLLHYLLWKIQNCDVCNCFRCEFRDEQLALKREERQRKIQEKEEQELEKERVLEALREQVLLISKWTFLSSVHNTFDMFQAW